MLAERNSPCSHIVQERKSLLDPHTSMTHGSYGTKIGHKMTQKTPDERRLLSLGTGVDLPPGTAIPGHLEEHVTDDQRIQTLRKGLEHWGP